LTPILHRSYRAFASVGGDICRENSRYEAGEAVAAIRSRGSQLRGIEVQPERAAAMRDEYPIVAMAAACAEGRTVMRGLAELRVKESDRLAGVARGLAACGVEGDGGRGSQVVQG